MAKNRKPRTRNICNSPLPFKDGYRKPAAHHSAINMGKIIDFRQVEIEDRVAQVKKESEKAVRSKRNQKRNCSIF